MNAPFIRCDNLVKIYKVAELEVVALQGLDLVVTEGELLGVVVASGSGKRTRLHPRDGRAPGGRAIFDIVPSALRASSRCSQCRRWCWRSGPER